MIKKVNVKMKQYDLRQLRLISEKINLFKNKQIEIHYFINDIRALLDILTYDKKWKKDFYDFWFLLEQVYAVSLHNKEPLSTYQRQIDEAVQGMESLIAKSDLQ